MKIASLTLCAVALTGCGSSSSDKSGGERAPEATVLTLANGTSDSRGLDAFAMAAERLSGGTLRIRFTNDWRRGEPDYEAGLVSDVAAGKADLGATGTRAFGGTALDALIAPLLIDSYPLERAVLESPLAERLLGEVEERGVTGIGVLPGPLRKLLGATPLLAPSDFRGATIAHQASEVAGATLAALGARPAEIPAVTHEIAAFDGIEQQVSSLGANQYDEGGKFLAANVNLWPRPVAVFANPAAFAGLDDRQRTALRRAARETIPEMARFEQAEDAEGATGLCGRGVQFLVAGRNELTALRRAVQPVYDRLGQYESTRAAIAEIEAVRDRVDARPNAPRCARRPAQPDSRPTPIDGIYLLSSGREEVAREAGEPAEATPPENYGKWRFVFDRGLLRYTQANHGAERWTRATYTVAGRTVVITVTEFGGEAPTDAAEKTGEEFTFRWSLYRDQLTLRPVKGKVSPSPFTAKPLRRVGDAR